MYFLKKQGNHSIDFMMPAFYPISIMTAKQKVLN